jgi:hypothetical protein
VRDAIGALSRELVAALAGGAGREPLTVRPGGRRVRWLTPSRREGARARPRRLRALPEPWVALCIVAGVAIGQFLPAVPATLQRFTYAEVSIPIAC